MFLIIEIVLTIIAWIRGWKWRSLIPIGSAVFIGFFLGALWTLFGGDPFSSSLTGWVLILDLIVIGILIYMVSKPYKKDDEYINKKI